MECAGLGGGLGEDFALGVDDEARAGIGKMRIAAGAVHADYVSEVLDSAGGGWSSDRREWRASSR